MKRKLYLLKLKESDSLQNIKKMMTEIFVELSDISDPIDEENTVEYLLASLPDSNDVCNCARTKSGCAEVDVSDWTTALWENKV